MFNSPIINLIFQFRSIIWANFLILTVFIVIWIFSYQMIEAKSKRRYFLSLLFFLLMSLYHFYANSAKLWFLFLILTLVNAIGIFLANKYIIKVDSLKKQIRSIIIIGLSLAILLPLIFVVSYKISVHGREKNIDGDMAKVHESILSDQDLNLNKAKNISNDIFIKQFLGESRYSELSAYSQNLMISQELSYFVITDKTGQVIVRAENPDAIGDNFFKKIPKANKVFEDNTFQSIETAMNNNLVSISGTTIKDEDGDKTIGAIFVGKYLNDYFANSLAFKKDLNIIFYSNDYFSGYFPSFDQKGKRYFSNEYLNEFYKEKGRLAQDGKIVSIDNKNFFMAQSELLDKSGNQIGNVVIIENADIQNKMITLTTWIFIIISLLVFSFLIFKSNRFRSNKGSVIDILISDEEQFKINRMPKKLSSNAIMRLKYLDKIMAKTFYYTRISLWKINRYLSKRANIIIAEMDFVLGISFVFLMLVFISNVSARSFANNIKYDQIIPTNNSQIVSSLPSLSLKLEKRYFKTNETIPVKIVANLNYYKTSSSSLYIRFNAQNLNVEGFDGIGSSCVNKPDTRIDNISGEVVLTCDLQDQTGPQAPTHIYTVNFKAKSSGIGTFEIDQERSFLLTDKGKFTSIVESFKNGEQVLITQ